jgi:hypothetical protein
MVGLDRAGSRPCEFRSPDARRVRRAEVTLATMKFVAMMTMRFVFLPPRLFSGVPGLLV